MTRKLPIPRGIWLRGEGESSGFLMRKGDHKKCCVGIYLHACGVPEAALENIAAAGELARAGVHIPEEALWLLRSEDGNDGDTTDATELYTTNDDAEEEKVVEHGDDCDGDYCDCVEQPFNSPWFEKVREESVAKYFARHGVEVEFTD